MTPEQQQAITADRDELARLVAAECDRLAEKWWDDRETYRWSIENDPFWQQPLYWLNQSRPPVRACATVLARILDWYEPGETVQVYELLDWINDRSRCHHDNGDRRLAHGFYRATKAIREGTGFGWGGEVDAILGRCL